MNRRAFLASVAAALTLDPERLLWVPGKKLISVPAPRVEKRFLTVGDVITFGGDPQRYIVTHGGDPRTGLGATFATPEALGYIRASNLRRNSGRFGRLLPGEAEQIRCSVNAYVDGFYAHIGETA